MCRNVSLVVEQGPEPCQAEGGAGTREKEA